MTELTVPPLFSAEAVPGADPFERACAQAALGCDAGLVTHNITDTDLRASMVFAPEVPLLKAMAMLPLCGIGFQNALGALAPPEVAVHLDWDGGLRLNGGACGKLRIAASTAIPQDIPDWLVVGLHLPLWPETDSPATPDETTLYAEGCADVDPARLTEAWVRHTLVWINRWSDEGTRPLHSEWRPLAHGLGEEITQNGLTGTFTGVDEDFGMLLKDANTTHLIPLTTRLETP